MIVFLLVCGVCANGSADDQRLTTTNPTSTWPPPPLDMPPERRICCRKFQNVASDRSGMIARSSEYAFYRLVAGINPQNTPMARRDSCHHRRTTGAFYGLYTGSSPVKCIFACSGHRLRSIRRNGPGFSTTYAVLGGLSGGGVHGGGVGCFPTTGRKKY